MKFKYIGNHPQITQHEITFRRNEPVEIGGKKLKIRKSVRTPTGRMFEEREIDIETKLAGNPDFEEVLEYEGNEILLKPKRGRPRGNQSRDNHQSPAEA